MYFGTGEPADPVIDVSALHKRNIEYSIYKLQSACKQADIWIYVRIRNLIVQAKKGE